jgi:hypothetical protein
MNNQRFGTFSSSAAHKLIKLGSRKMTADELIEFKKNNPKSTKKNCADGFSEAGLTYIKETGYELKLGRALGSEQGARATSWGTFVESIVFGKLDLSYKLESQIRLAHKTVERWTGAPDTIRENVVGDIKCPWTLKSFCETVEAMEIGIEAFKELRPEYYWQLVSNAILTDSGKGEIIIYVPYLSELEPIREEANNYDGDQNKIAFINWAEDNELPYLPDGGHYKNLNKLEFDIPEEDKIFLTERIILANEYLNK